MTPSKVLITLVTKFHDPPSRPKHLRTAQASQPAEAPAPAVKAGAKKKGCPGCAWRVMVHQHVCMCIYLCVCMYVYMDIDVFVDLVTHLVSYLSMYVFS